MSQLEKKLTKNYQQYCYLDSKIIRITVIGDEDTGKSSLIKALIQNKFTKEYTQTLGFNVITVKKSFKYKEKMLVFIDVSGQSCFKEVRKSCYSGIQLIIAVSDVTRPNTLENIENFWLPEYFQSNMVDKNSTVDVQLVGNKNDLESDIKLTIDDLTRSALKISAKYPQVNIIMPCLLTSAKESLVSPSIVIPHLKSNIQQNSL